MPHDAVLIIGAGPLQVPLIREAKALGLSTIVTDGNPDAPGMEVADEPVQGDTYDQERQALIARIVQEVRGGRLRGVCTAGADVAPSVAAAAAAAGVPGIPRAVAQRTHNKYWVRRALMHTVSRYQPQWLCCHATDDPEATLRRNAFTYPVVVKPLSERASRGVTIVDEPTMLGDAVAKVLQYGNRYLLEAYLRGTEHSAEIILDGPRNVLWHNIVDRPFDYSTGTGIELGHVNPTALRAAEQEEIYIMVCACAAALGVEWGAWKVDVMLTENGPKVLEVTARLSGGYDCQATSPLTGRNPLRQLLQLSCGFPVDPQPPAHGYAACAAILPQQRGRVMTLPTLPPWLDGDVRWMIHPGDSISPAEHNGERPGFVLTHASTYDDAWFLAKTAADTLADALAVVS